MLVVWNYLGLTTEDMERRVVFISERACSTTVNGIQRIESQSIPGVGMLKVYFQPGTDIGASIAQITAVNNSIPRSAPPGMQPPGVIQFNASNIHVAQKTMSSKNLSEQEIFDYGLLTAPLDGTITGNNPSANEKAAIAVARGTFIAAALMPRFLPRVQPTTFNCRSIAMANGLETMTGSSRGIDPILPTRSAPGSTRRSPVWAISTGICSNYRISAILAFGTWCSGRSRWRWRLSLLRKMVSRIRFDRTRCWREGINRHAKSLIPVA